MIENGWQIAQIGFISLLYFASVLRFFRLEPTES
jgi:hypothetical protein